ncbi:hypothetical protein R6Q59_007115 [Mikania micrantha]
MDTRRITLLKDLDVLKDLHIEEGTKFEASVTTRHCSRYENLLQEKQCLFIHRPSLAENRYKYKVFGIPRKLCFNEKTLVANCSDNLCSEYGFDFVSFKTMDDNFIPQNSTVATYL